MRIGRTGLPLAIVLFAGCGGDRESTDPVGSIASPIYAPDAGDPTVIPDDRMHPQVVSIKAKRPNEWQTFCTATIIASNKVLTAAHCVDPLANGTLPDRIEVYVAHNAPPDLEAELAELPSTSLNDKWILVWEVSSVLVHPLWAGALASSDIAILTMASEIPPTMIRPLPVLGPLLPAPSLPDTSGLDTWTGYVAEVFGAGNTSEGCDAGAPSEVQRHEMEILGIGSEFPGYNRFQFADLSPWGGHTCGGDSGGPIVTIPSDFVGQNNIPPGHIVSLLHGGTPGTYGYAYGPILTDINRPFLVQHALDADADGIEAAFDNCDHKPNPDQTPEDVDTDGDGWPDANCDDDDDNDGILDEGDNCPTVRNANQQDTDEDKRGDACDSDDDADTVPDEEDNCPSTYNPLQENCNELAERLLFGNSNGHLLGDACDPVPCATPSTPTREFIKHTETWSNPAGSVCVHQHGRSIQNIVSLSPMRGAGSSPLPTQDVEVRFCPCEANDPVACQEPPWNCELSPTAGTQPGSHWLALSLTEIQDPDQQVAQPLSTVYEPWVQSPQPHDDYGWNYLADYESWVVDDEIWTPTEHDPSLYGPGTDMRGLLWVEDSTTEGGYSSHGACLDDGCSMASSYLADVQPDRAETITRCNKMPSWAPPPWWSYCARCGDWLRLPYESVINPAFVSVIGDQAVLWTDTTAAVPGIPTGAGVNVTEAFSMDLRNALTSSNLVWVGPSSPIEELGANAPLAFSLSADATKLAGAVEVNRAGYAHCALGASTGIPARSGFATAYSAADQTLFVVGGSIRGKGMSEMWSYGPTGTWTRQRLSAAPAINAETAVYARRHLWIVDRENGSRALKRVNLATGDVTSQRLTQLTGVEQAWLLALEDGEVVLVTARAGAYEVLWLDASTRAVTVRATLRGNGRLAMAPGVRGANISVPILVGTSDAEWIEPVAIPLKALR